MSEKREWRWWRDERGRLQDRERPEVIDPERKETP